MPINLPAVGEKLWRALNLRGGLNPDGLGSVVAADIMALDLTQPQYAWLARSKRYAAGFTVAASVGNNSQFEVRNLAGSGVIVELNRVWVRASTSTGIGFFLSTVANLSLSTNVRTLALDGRQEEAGILSSPQPITQVTSGATVSGVAATDFFNTLKIDVPLELEQPVVLKPGTYFRARAGTTNIALDVILEWTERIPAPSEL